LPQSTDWPNATGSCAVQPRRRRRIIAASAFAGSRWPTPQRLAISPRDRCDQDLFAASVAGRGWTAQDRGRVGPVRFVQSIHGPRQRRPLTDGLGGSLADPLAYPLGRPRSRRRSGSVRRGRIVPVSLRGAPAAAGVSRRKPTAAWIAGRKIAALPHQEIETLQISGTRIEPGRRRHGPVAIPQIGASARTATARSGPVRRAGRAGANPLVDAGALQQHIDRELRATAARLPDPIIAPDTSTSGSTVAHSWDYRAAAPSPVSG